MDLCFLQERLREAKIIFVFLQERFKEAKKDLFSFRKDLKKQKEANSANFYR